MLSNDALKLLKWFEKENGWKTEIEAQQNCKYYGDRSFKALHTDKYLEKRMDLDSSQWAKYRISDAGKAYLEGARYANRKRAQDWLSLLFSAIALAVSIISEIS